MSGPKPQDPRPPVPLPAGVSHPGFRAYAKYGCRCVECLEHNRAYGRALYRLRKESKGSRRVPPGKHGRVGTYNYYGCRCDSCREARAVYEDGRKARRERDREEREP